MCLCWQIADSEEEVKEIENLKKMAKEAMGAVFSAVVDSVGISSECCTVTVLSHTPPFFCWRYIDNDTEQLKYSVLRI